MNSLTIELEAPQVDGDQSMIVIGQQAEKIKQLERKIKSAEKRVIKYRMWYGELWDILDELNGGDIDKAEALGRWLDYGMNGKS